MTRGSRAFSTERVLISRFLGLKKTAALLPPPSLPPLGMLETPDVPYMPSIVRFVADLKVERRISV